MASGRLKILPLGGLGEIGMNCLVLEWDRNIVLIDCGVEFPDYRYPGVDYLVPDFSYLIERKDQVKAVIVTHGHDDHIGGIPFLAKFMDLKVFAPPFPRGLIEAKLAEHGDLRTVELIDTEPGKIFQAGPFTVEPAAVSHSTADAFGLGIHTPGGFVVHSGDFKCDAHADGTVEMDFGPFEAWGKRGVQLLLSDSTNATRPGFTPSEREVVESFEGILDEQHGRILIALFASNVHRVESFLHLAHARGKKVALLGRSMHSYLKLAHDLGVIRIPESTLILINDLDKYPESETLVLATGSQAEPQSALARVSQGMHKDFQARPGDTIYLSSRFIPGNERAIMMMINDLCRRGARVIHGGQDKIHVSGHASQEELRMMIRAVRPERFVPVHGEMHHLMAHAELAAGCGIPEGNIQILTDGMPLELGESGWRVEEPVPLQKRVVVDGVFMDETPELHQERLRLSRCGVVVATVLKEKGRWRLKARPNLLAHGVVLRQGTDMESALRDAAMQLEADFEDLVDCQEPLEALRLYVRRFFKNLASAKPIVRIQVIEI